VTAYVSKRWVRKRLGQVPHWYLLPSCLVSPRRYVLRHAQVAGASSLGRPPTTFCIW
jgi:hypothetical protein